MARVLEWSVCLRHLEDMLGVAIHDLSAPVEISELFADQHCYNDTDLAGFQSL
jgi:hypothetical protein